MFRVSRLIVSALAASASLVAQGTPSWRYDFRTGDHLVYRYTFHRQVRSNESETVIEARFHTHVLIADVRGGVISAGFQRNRDSADLLTSRIKGKDKLAEERPKFEKRMQARPAQFSEAMELNTVGEPQDSWEVARESPSHILPALHEIEVLPVHAPGKPGDQWHGMNLLGMDFEFVGSEPVQGRACYHVKGLTADGSVIISYWWSPASGVIERVELDGTYPVFGGTSHEQARMELESHTRGEPLSDWLVKPETKLAALQALLLSPAAATTPEQLTASLKGGNPEVQRLGLAVARRRGLSLAQSSLDEVAGSRDEEVMSLAGDLVGAGKPSPPTVKCKQAEAKKADVAKFGTLLRVALSEKSGAGVPYFLRIPLSYRPDRATPLLVYLSGGAGIALDGVSSANDAIGSTNYLVLYPQAAGYWWKPEVAARLDRVMRDVFREFNVDRDRVHIAGFSNGGTGALYMAELWPQRFAAVVSLMGAGRCMDEVKQRLLNLTNLPLLLVHGEKDPIISPDCSRATKDDLTDLRARIAPPLRILPDREHDITLTSDDGLTLPYLKDKVRDVFPKRVNARIPDLEFPRQYWVEVLEKKSGTAEVDAEIKKGNVVEIRSSEVKRLRLYLRQEMFPQPGPVRVRWNGNRVYEGSVQDACTQPGTDLRADPQLDLTDRKEFSIP